MNKRLYRKISICLSIESQPPTAELMATMVDDCPKERERKMDIENTGNYDKKKIDVNLIF